MTNVLLLGGTSLIGEEIIKQSPYKICYPSSKKLNLCDTEQLDNINLKKYDIVILNAGVGMGDHEEFSKNKSNKILKIFHTNTIGNFILVKNYLACRHNGTILYVGSRATTLCKQSNIAYATSKLAVTTMFSSLQTYYKNFNFLVLNPGKVKSRLNKKEKDYLNYIEPKDLAEKAWYMIENKILKMDYYE